MTCAVSLLLVLSAAPLERLAILELEARGVDKQLTQNVGNLVAAAVRKTQRFEVLAKDDLEKIMRFEESRQLAGASANTGTIARMASDLGVAKLMHGSIGKMGTAYVLTLSLMHVETVTVLASDTVTVKGPPEALVEAAQELVNRLFVQLDEREGKK